MKNKKNAAFTLIELLVVVLIIGILAAVTFPQYQRAADKAAVSCVMPILRSLVQAQAVAAMEQGGYPVPNKEDLDGSYFHFSDLSVSIPADNWDSCQDSSLCAVTCGGRRFNLVLRSRAAWANFYWTSGSLARLVYEERNGRRQFVLQCPLSDGRCINLGRSHGAEACNYNGQIDEETSGFVFYCW